MKVQKIMACAAALVGRRDLCDYLEGKGGADSDGLRRDAEQMLRCFNLAENEAAPVSLKKNKLGFVFGMPVALSYSHEFTDLVELDLLVSTYPFLWRLIGEMSVYCGVLFTLADGAVKDRPWALTLGPSVGTTLLFSGGFDASLDLYADLRWEIDFPQTSRVNFFLNLGWGAVMRFDGGTVDALFPPRGGFGVRGRF